MANNVSDKFPVSESQRKERLSFATAYKDKPAFFGLTAWSFLMNNDLCKSFLLSLHLTHILNDIYIFSLNRDGTVTRHIGSESVIIPNSTPVWVCIGGASPNFIRKINSRLNTKQYISYLNDYILLETQIE